MECFKPSVVGIATLGGGTKDELHGRDRGRGEGLGKDFMGGAESTGRLQRSEERQLACGCSCSLSRVVFLRGDLITVQTTDVPYIRSGDDDVVVCMNHLPLVRDTAVT